MRTDRASRLIHAAPARVYAAFTDPQALVRWLPPEGMAGEMLAFEPGPGGGYRMALIESGAAPGTFGDIVESKFVELVPNRRIVQLVEFEADEAAFAGVMTMTWTLEATGADTRVAIVCENVPAGIRKQDHAARLKSSLANLALHAEDARGE